MAWSEKAELRDIFQAFCAEVGGAPGTGADDQPPRAFLLLTLEMLLSFPWIRTCAIRDNLTGALPPALYPGVKWCQTPGHPIGTGYHRL